MGSSARRQDSASRAGASSLVDDLVGTALDATEPTESLRLAASRTFFDFCACVVGGSKSAPAAWPSVPAGRLAFCAHSGDQDDVHHASLTHPGGIVWSVVVASALERDISFGEAGRAAALGYELTARLGDAATAEHRRRWHVAATAGTVGAAGAAAWLRGGDRIVTANAVAHAASVAGGSAHAIVERSGTRLLHRSHAACSGLACAEASCAGLPASKHVLETSRSPLGHEEPDLRAKMLRPREAAAIEETSLRIHPATGFAHAAIDAALALPPLAPDEIESVTATVSPSIAVALASNPTPENDEDAWWSIEHAIAVCLASRDVDLLTAGLSTRVDVLDLCRRVELNAGMTGWSASLQVTLRDGASYTSEADWPLGHPTRSASRDDLLKKWFRLTGEDGSAFFDRALAASEDDSFNSLVEAAFSSCCRKPEIGSPA